MRERRHAAVAGIIAAALGCRSQDVPDDAPVGSLPQWDSIAHMNIIMAFEERLGRQLTAEETASLETVASFAALLEPQAPGGA